MIDISELFTQLPDALNKRVISHDDVRPDGLEKLLLGHQPSSVFRQISKDLERLGRQVDVLLTNPEATAREIEREAVEPQNPRNGLVHLAAPLGVLTRRSEIIGERSAFRHLSIRTRVSHPPS